MRIASAITLLILSNFLGSIGRPTAETDALQLNLRNLTQQHSFSLKDSVVLNFEIINSSSEPVGVFAKLGMGFQGGVILHILDASGAEVQPPTLPHDSLDSHTMQDAKNFFELQPGQFFGTRQRFIVSELVSKSGHYKLLAEYHCPVDPKYAKVRNFWSIERKSVVSTELEFNVD